MRKQFLILGIVLLLFGLVVVGLAERQTLKTIPYEMTASNAWEISGDYCQGDNIYLVTVPGYPNWSWWAEDPELDPITGEPLPQTLNVTITDPYNVEAKFKVFYASPPPGYSYYTTPGQHLPILLSKVELIEAGSLGVKDPPDGIGGVVNHNGTYVARVIKEWWMWGPAESLVLHREVFEKEYAYIFLLPVGGAVFLLGVVLAVWGAKSSRHKIKVKPKRKP